MPHIWIRRDGAECSEIAFGDRGSRTTFEIAPGTSRTVALDRYCRNNVASSPQTPLHRKLSVQLRRRLSELRDNYLSKSPAMLSLAKSVHARDFPIGRRSGRHRAVGETCYCRILTSRLMTSTPLYRMFAVLWVVSLLIWWQAIAADARAGFGAGRLHPYSSDPSY